MMLQNGWLWPTETEKVYMGDNLLTEMTIRTQKRGQLGVHLSDPLTINSFFCGLEHTSLGLPQESQKAFSLYK